MNDVTAFRAEFKNILHRTSIIPPTPESAALQENLEKVDLKAAISLIKKGRWVILVTKTWWGIMVKFGGRELRVFNNQHFRDDVTYLPV